MSEDGCARCRFWLEINQWKQGLCRRHAPVAGYEPAPGISTGFPLTSFNQWCGDYDFASCSELDRRAAYAIERGEHLQPQKKD